jgi:U3 small nucleolar RNA-associated protein 6
VVWQAGQSDNQKFTLLALLTHIDACLALPIYPCLQAFELCSDSPSELQQLQQLLLSTITRAAVKGPARGGLGAAAAACLQLTWRVQGADAARVLWRKLLLLPPAGGDMFGAMVQLETAAAADGQTLASKKQQDEAAAAAAVLPNDALQRVRAVYDAWVAAYGSSDVELWVQYALFEQAQGLQGPGRVYWRAVKAVEEPDEFIQQYRSRVGLV